MAELHPARRKAKSSRLRSVDRPRIKKGSGLHRQRASLSLSSFTNGGKTSVQLKALLREVSRLLTGIYSTCVIAELALQRQNAGHDVLAILRLHVSEPLSRQIENLDSLVVE